MNLRWLVVAAASGLGVFSHAQVWLGEPLNLTPGGGTFATSNGKVKIIAPSGAVSTPTMISVLPNPYAPDSPNFVLDTAFVVGRGGATFNKPVTLFIKYNPAALLTGVSEANLRLFRVVDHRWTLVPSSVDMVNKLVSGGITHPGTYGIIGSTVDVPAEGALLFQYGSGTQPFLYRYSFRDQSVRLLGNIVGQTVGLASNTESASFLIRPHSTGIDIFAANIDGSDPVRAVAYSNVNNLSSGGLAADDSVFIAGVESGGVWRVYKTTLTSTTQLSVGGSTGAPVISHQGDKVAFGDNGTLTIVNSSNGALIKSITTGGTAIKDIAFSHSGSEVAFSMVKGSSVSAIYTVGVNGLGLAKRSQGFNDYNPAWSPDDSQIAFYTFGPGGNSPGLFALASNANGVVGVRLLYDPYFAPMTFVWR